MIDYILTNIKDKKEYKDFLEYIWVEWNTNLCTTISRNYPTMCVLFDNRDKTTIIPVPWYMKVYWKKNINRLSKHTVEIIYNLIKENE